MDFVAFLSRKNVYILSQSKEKSAETVQSECDCGMQALAAIALICAIFPLSHSGPITLKSYTDSPKERSQCAAEQKPDIAVCDHLRADSASGFAKSIQAHLRGGILCGESYVAICS